MLLDCPMNSSIFRQYVEQCLAPDLKPGDIVVPDNLASHKASRVREMIEARGAEPRYLPPYSPDHNPIEQAISKIKAPCERPPPAPSTACAKTSAGSSTASPQPNAATSSAIQDMRRLTPKPL